MKQIHERTNGHAMNYGTGMHLSLGTFEVPDNTDVNFVRTGILNSGIFFLSEDLTANTNKHKKQQKINKKKIKRKRGFFL